MAAFESIGVRYIVTGADVGMQSYAPSATRVFHDELVAIWRLPHATPYYSAVRGSCRLRPEGFNEVAAICRGSAVIQREELALAGWSATVNGQPSELRPSHDSLFSTVTVPAGSSTIVWSYRPGHLRTGEAMAVFGVAMLAAPFAWRVLRRREAGEVSEADDVVQAEDVGRAVTTGHASEAGWRQHRWQDLAGLASVVAMAMAYLSPAVKDGWSFGPYDAGANGTIGHPGSPANAPTYNRISGDLINQGIPWNALDRMLIHAGHLPLWDSYNMLGLPQLFNFESSAFSLPDLISYGVPLRTAWLVIVFVKLLIAGTGAYVLCRQLGTRPLAASFGAITFMLSGGFASWLGWSLSGVVAWAPWICAFILLAYRDSRRRWPVLLAVSVMFAFFGGFPEMYALLAGALLAFVVFGALALALTRRRVSIGGSLRGLIGLVAGVALATPLLLPGEQLLKLSTHAALHTRDAGTSVSRLSLLVAPGYYGLPIRGSITFPGVNFYETVFYVGVIALALAFTGLCLARRQAAVIGIAGLTVVCLLATVRIDATDLAGRLLIYVGLGSVHAIRARLVAGLGISVLGAVGLEEILHRPRPSARKTWLVAVVLGAGFVVALIISSLSEHLQGYQASERLRSLVWPCALVLVLVCSAVALLVAGRRDRPLHAGWRVPIGVGLVGAQAAFLVFAGVGLNSYSGTGFKQYEGVTVLQRIVGRDLVGLDGAYPGSPKVWPRLGFYPNLNIAYRVAEFAGHDPLLPASYARDFPGPVAQRAWSRAAQRSQHAGHLLGADGP